MKEFIKVYYVQLIIIAILFASTVFMLMQSRHIMTMVEEKSADLRKIQLDRVIAAEFLQDVHVFKKNSEYINENIEALDVFLPDSDEMKVKLFSDIENIAKDTGNGTVTLEVMKENPKNPKKTKTNAAVKDSTGQKTLNMKISLIGSYNDLIAFVKKIENMKYCSRINSFNIAKVEPRSFDPEEIDERSDLINTDMNVDFYLDN